MCLTEHYRLSREIQWNVLECWHWEQQQCGNAVLSSSHQVAQFSLNIPAGLSCGSPPKNKQKQKKQNTISEEVKFCQQPPLYFLSSSVFLEWCLRVEMSSTVAYLCCQISVLYTKVSNPWRTSTKTSATSVWPSHFWRSSGKKGFLYKGKKKRGGIVPISSGKRATVGINTSVLGNKSQGMMDQDLGMSKAGGEGDRKVATFILGAEGWGHQIS